MRGADAPAVPPGADAATLARALAGFHDDFLATGRIAPTVRRVVADSWRRSLTGGLDPETVGIGVRTGEALEDLRRRSPLRRSMPVVRRLLVEAATDAGLVVAVSDASGQLLWVEGDHGLRSRAEAMRFVAGADWSEPSAGTNAPGTALRTGRPVQILGPEHLMRPVTPWSCTAVPIHDPDTRELLGALDVTGRAEVAQPQTLALVRATVAAVEAELRIDRLRGRRPVRTARPAERPARLEVLGRATAVLEHGGRRLTLGLRHSEILLLLSERPGGLSGAELAVALSEREQSEVTVRAEISRLRAVLPPGALTSRPYALRTPVASDLATVRSALGEHRVGEAVRAYGGPVLPASGAPGVVELRDDLSLALRERLLAADDLDALITYAEGPSGRDDAALWTAVARRLPAGSDRRTVVEQHLRALDARLA
ncbi:GAF domain-containing protein [Microlunatus flavus]|uniref:GAF domain-containing protein n=1 Tax=Microlunatus flavus TaxID=1036181 RepID=A0A1H9ESL0_9ACTN|nr:GAF domain-containing protein [Microlunatus flavus]SEQ28674.1 GAF domain-containing protein [Microlunatus flavus]